MLRSRNGHDVTEAYPGIAACLQQQPVSAAAFDCEIVAIDAGGRPSFELLQQRMNLQEAAAIASAEKTIPTMCYVFDVMHLDGYDLTRVQLRARREVLSRVLLPLGQVAQVFAIPASAEDAYQAAVAAAITTSSAISSQVRVLTALPADESARGRCWPTVCAKSPASTSNASKDTMRWRRSME